MCLILFAHRANPDFPLIVAANRDEFYARATRPAQFWPEAPVLLAGKDEVAGGTWLGITRTGRFAAITNFREGTAKTSLDVASRGTLTKNFLLGNDSAEAYAKKILNSADIYNGFNLLLGDQNQLVYCNNINNELSILVPGFYGLSNHLLNTPWPKVTQGTAGLRTALTSQQSTDAHNYYALSKELQTLLTNRIIADEENLPSTGVSLEREKILSSIFIETPQYGTCCSTTLIQTKHNGIFFTESNHYPNNKSFFETEFILSEK